LNSFPRYLSGSSGGLLPASQIRVNLAARNARFHGGNRKTAAIAAMT